ncbi:PD-(D/E)XK motif protein [Pusillimonas minor]|uniref:PD-(D/E)XK motif protein n=1 Tax=Pusillimonas minor TaxID=2697024 RepID=A0A842HS92_9BURK|nr:PD-(D/E)XK motif protein [Pusillimonas minor]
MISNNTPWSGLEAGKVDTRRVDACARWNWFWAVMPHADAALVLQLSSLPEPAPDLPTLKNLEIRFQTLPGGPILFIRLKDSTQIELFETLCRDVIAAGELAETEAEALERAVRRTFRWHYLLRSARVEALTEDAQKGLIGEIEVLKLLIASLGVKTALDAWTGPSGAPKDFELVTDCIEVKAKRGASQPFVNIANEHQLTDVPGRRLWLAVIAVDKAQPPHGRTLSEYVNEVTQLLEQSDPSAIMDWDLRLADTGYDVLHDYSHRGWITSPSEFFSVTEGFPRITAPTPLGVSGVTYALALSACAPFRTNWDSVRLNLQEAQQP